MGTGSVFMMNDSLGIMSEIAYAESGMGFYFKLVSDGFDIRLWHYDKSYLNLQSSGYAYPDYLTFDDESSGLSYRQTQAGESGFLFKKSIAVGRLSVVGLSEFWKRASDGIIGRDYSLAGRFFPVANRYLFGRLSGRATPDSERKIVEVGAGSISKFRIMALTSLYFEHDRAIQSRSFSQLFCSVMVAEALSLGARIRLKHDGNHEYFTEERISFISNTILVATYRWDDDTDNGVGPLYITLERVF